MTAAVRRRKAARKAAPGTPAAAVQDELGQAGVGVTPAQADTVATAAVAAAPATQVRRPWRSTVRTLFQIAVGLAPMLPALVSASGVDETAAPVAGALAISGAVTRVMSLPAVEHFLQLYVPWLAAAPGPSSS